MTMSGDPLDHGSNGQSDGASNRDLLAATGYAVLAAAALAFGDPLPPALRVPIALPLLLFVPGYAVVTALLPGGFRPTGPSNDDGGPLGAGDGVTRLERATLAVGASLAILPTVALVANALVGVRLVPVLAGLVLVTLFASILAATRRRADAAAGNGRQTARTQLSLPAPTDAIPNDAMTLAAVCVAVLLLGTSAAVALAGGPSDGPNTELAIGTESDGEFVAEGYPAAIDAEERTTMDVAVEHGDDEARSYEAVVTIDRVLVGDDEATVLDAAELDRFETTVGPDERVVETIAVAPADADAAFARTDGDRRVTVLLYEGDAPDEPDHEAAHRTVTVPVEVTDG